MEYVHGQEELKSTTIEEFENLCERAFELRREADKLQEAHDETKRALTELQQSIVRLLLEHGKESYRARTGTVSVSKRLAVRCPQGADKEKFFEYLKTKGIFEDIATVHSATLNAYYKGEMEAARSQGQDIANFQIPGVGAPTYFETLNMRKG